jgi:hypothetical protein
MIWQQRNPGRCARCSVRLSGYRASLPPVCSRCVLAGPDIDWSVQQFATYDHRGWTWTQVQLNASVLERQTWVVEMETRSVDGVNLSDQWEYAGPSEWRYTIAASSDWDGWNAAVAHKNDPQEVIARGLTWDECASACQDHWGRVGISGWQPNPSSRLRV